VRSAAAIVNPCAGSPRRRRAVARALARLERLDFTLDILPTRGPRHATELAAASARRYPLVVAVGGDGTVHEVACGLLGSDAVLGVLPCGSGNDFACGIGVATEAAALAALAAGVRSALDVGRLGDRVFFNSIGLFLSGRVSARAARLWRPLGPLRYVAAALTELVRYRPETAFWELVGAGGRSGPFLLAEICNGRRTGGGFYLVPDADPGDGELDLCLVRPLGLAPALRLLPDVMAGRRAEHAAIERLRVREGELRLPSAVTVHVDGEPERLPPGCYALSLLPGALQVAAPGPSATRKGPSP
jgi:diacylglycerol kinase (ATP)